MECLFTSCKTKKGPDSERFTNSWLRERAKCAGIIGRDADAVLNPSKVLRWSCPDCTEREIDFDKLFTQTKDGFSQLSKNLMTFCEKFETIKTLLDECRYLEESSSLLVKHQLVV